MSWRVQDIKELVYGRDFLVQKGKEMRIKVVQMNNLRFDVMK